jgi:hypothetical protein
MDAPIVAARPVICVLGMHRSGTSLCANMLQALGLDMADDAGISPSNERGHWERARINDLNDQVFTIFGRAWASASHVLSLPVRWLEDPRVHAVRATRGSFMPQPPELDAAAIRGARKSTSVPRTACTRGSSSQRTGKDST